MNGLRKKAAAAENMSKLPELAYAAVAGEAVLCVVKRGEKGYHRTDYAIGKRDVRKFVDAMNRRLKVSGAQREAMINGSIFGWHVPGANPDDPINRESGRGE